MYHEGQDHKHNFCESDCEMRKNVLYYGYDVKLLNAEVAR